MISKWFLASVGLMYLGLSFWCTLSPAVTSDKVGFQLDSGSGESEFLVIYGGLQLGLCILFCLPLVDFKWLEFSLMSCIIIHACLVIFRTIGFFVYADFAPITFNLALGEWAIFLLATMCKCMFQKQANQ